ncbi:dioxygenase family protein [Nocardia yamanashiensis]|uniref:dioxygenase family protein n=1 Tax=Nocardia yamanashiensis TaxID=209247 RepID=UPI0008303AFD
MSISRNSSQRGIGVAAVPAEGPGPYPADGSNGPDVLLDAAVVRSDIRSSFGPYAGVAPGVSMTLRLWLRDLGRGGATGAGMAVYVWHCDRDGRYSLYDGGVADQNYLRGVQVADANGGITFTSVFPACYAGRWPHIHFEVFDSLGSAMAREPARLTSQIALPRPACQAVYAFDPGYARSLAELAHVSLETDKVFRDGWNTELATVVGTPAEGLRISLTVGVAPSRPTRT